MRVEVDVCGAEQSWDFDTGKQQNYLVVDVFGVKVTAPCTAEQLAGVIAALHADEVEVEEAEDAPLDESVPVAAAPVFRAAGEEAPRAQPAPAPAPARQLAPVRRQRGDDVGISQG